MKHRHDEETGDLFGYLPYGGAAPSQRHSRTSREAAEKIRKHIGPLHRKILDYLARHPNGASDERMSDALEIIQNTFRPRRRELELMGYIVDSGRIEQVRSGRDAVVWILTPQERR